MESKLDAATGKKAGRLTAFLILFGAFLAMIAAAAVGIGYNIHRYWEDVLRVEITRNLTQKAQMFAVRVNTEREHKLGEVANMEGQEGGGRAIVEDTNVQEAMAAVDEKKQRE